MNLWFDSIIIYIKIYFLSEGQNFNSFSSSIFPSLRMGTQNSTLIQLFKLVPKSALLNFIAFVIPMVLRMETKIKYLPNCFLTYFEVFSRI